MSEPTTPDRTSPKAPPSPRTPASGKAGGTPSITSTTTKPEDHTHQAASGSKPAEPHTSAPTGTTTSTPTASAESAGTSKPPVGASTGNSAATAVQKKKWYRRLRVRGPWLTVGGVVVVLVVLALVGYLWGLGPMSRLNTERGITPPAKLAGLERITDQQIRTQLQLDETRDALSRINDGKQATVEAYGNIAGNRMFVVIALRGKVDIDKTVSDSGATPDKIKKVGHSTCVESTANLPTQCYRGSNTLTVIAQSANEGVTVDAVEPVAEEAFNAMK